MRAAVIALAALLGCRGGGAGDGDADDAGSTGADEGDTAADTDGDTSDDDDDGTPSADDGVARMGMRRLSRQEYDNTVRDLLGDDSAPASLLPEDVRTPFDNDFTTQSPSKVLVEALEQLAGDVSENLVADPQRLASVLPCSPAGPGDEACLRAFVEQIGRRALRRPLDVDEVDDYVAIGMDYAGQADDFNRGIAVVVRAFLQDAEFVYRIERGTPVDGEPGLFALSPFEVGTRLSYLIVGSTPDDWLLDRAEAGELDKPKQYRAAAVKLLSDPRAKEQVDRFHAMWLGYDQLPHEAELSSYMRHETRALVERVVFEEPSSWLDLFSSTQTFINDDLAAHYGLPSPGPVAGWVDYGNSGRQGLLSHGSFLSAANDVSTTNPTKRGKFIRERLMCETIPPPPPEVNVDEPPSGGNSPCKWDRWAIHRSGGCASCHLVMDMVGFGLENYDVQGRYREHDEGLPQCTISGDGEIVGVGEFNGPDGLSELLVENGLLNRCATVQLFRYAMGRQETQEDARALDDLEAGFEASGQRFDELIVQLVSATEFGYRMEEEAP